MLLSEMLGDKGSGAFQTNPLTFTRHHFFSSLSNLSFLLESVKPPVMTVQSCSTRQFDFASSDFALNGLRSMILLGVASEQSRS
jgi:hypothetical protein